MKNFAKFFMVVMVVGMLPSSILAQENKTEDLLGVISKADLQKGPYATWYNENDQAYQVDQAALVGLDQLLEGVEVKIIMGTWCHDSKREVPRFYKILSNVATGEDKAEMIALDRKKQAPNNETEGMGITNTPTFIFYKDGKEMNRIVETPVESLEKDMVKILKGETYKHSKLLSE